MQADLHALVRWAQANDQRWAVTLSNAGSEYFEDCNQLAQLGEVDWDAVHANTWGGEGVDPAVKDGKQAEFLLEYCFPWHLVECIGVYSKPIAQQVLAVLSNGKHRPKVEIKQSWYY